MGEATWRFVFCVKVERVLLPQLGVEVVGGFSFLEKKGEEG